MLLLSWYISIDSLEAQIHSDILLFQTRRIWKLTPFQSVPKWFRPVQSNRLNPVVLLIMEEETNTSLSLNDTMCTHCPSHRRLRVVWGHPFRVQLTGIVTGTSVVRIRKSQSVQRRTRTQPRWDHLWVLYLFYDVLIEFLPLISITKYVKRLTLETLITVCSRTSCRGHVWRKCYY